MFDSLPASYRAMVENELNPTEMVPDDLYPLKQRAQAGPHHEFPLRSDIEPNFQVKGPFAMQDIRHRGITALLSLDVLGGPW